MTAANVIDVTWVLNEETGQLRYEGYRLVTSKPKQKLIVEHVSKTVTDELVKRYQRIASERRNRGLDNG